MIKPSVEKFDKTIQKLESIGKTGKINKVIEITEDHLAVVKSNPEDFSLKVIAYIIKGIFLTFKRNYECVYKDLQSFIEIYINGKKVIETNQKKKMIENKLDYSFSGRSNFLLSENNTLENFLNENTRMIKPKLIYAIEKVLKNDNENSTIKQEIVSKMIERSISKSNVQDNSQTQFNNEDDLERLDANFIYSRDIFSNFINFDYDLPENQFPDKSNGESKDKKTTDIKDPNLFKQFERNTNINEMNSEFVNKILKSENILNLVTKDKKINLDYIYDMTLELENKSINDIAYTNKNFVK